MKDSMQNILDELILALEIPDSDIVWTQEKLEWLAKQLRKRGVKLPEEEWIDVNDHLPTSDGRFMVTIKNKGKAHVEMRNFNVQAQKWGNEMFWDNDNVIAWQQRPQPFAPVLSE